MSSKHSECRDLCSVPPYMPGLASSTAAHGWNWQQGQPGSLQSSRLLEDDKQDLSTKSPALSQEADQRVTSHQSSRGGKNLGSSAESPTSVSSSPSPMSPGKYISTNGVTSGPSPRSGVLTSSDSDWDPHPSISKTGLTPNYCVIGVVVNDSYVEGEVEGKTETRPPHVTPRATKPNGPSAQCQTVPTWQYLLAFSCPINIQARMCRHPRPPSNTSPWRTNRVFCHPWVSHQPLLQRKNSLLVCHSVLKGYSCLHNHRESGMLEFILWQSA